MSLINGRHKVILDYHLKNWLMVIVPFIRRHLTLFSQSKMSMTTWLFSLYLQRYFLHREATKNPKSLNININVYRKNPMTINYIQIKTTVRTIVALCIFYGFWFFSLCISFLRRHSISIFHALLPMS